MSKSVEKAIRRRLMGTNRWISPEQFKEELLANPLPGFTGFDDAIYDKVDPAALEFDCSKLKARYATAERGLWHALIEALEKAEGIIAVALAREEMERAFAAYHDTARETIDRLVAELKGDRTGKHYLTGIAGGRFPWMNDTESLCNLLEILGKGASPGSRDYDASFAATVQPLIEDMTARLTA